MNQTNMNNLNFMGCLIIIGLMLYLLAGATLAEVYVLIWAILFGLGAANRELTRLNTEKPRYHVTDNKAYCANCGKKMDLNYDFFAIQRIGNLNLFLCEDKCAKLEKFAELKLAHVLQSVP